MTKRAFSNQQAALRTKQENRGIITWLCRRCDQLTVIFVVGRGRICMNCGHGP